MVRKFWMDNRPMIEAIQYKGTVESKHEIEAWEREHENFGVVFPDDEDIGRYLPCARGRDRLVPVNDGDWIFLYQGMFLVATDVAFRHHAQPVCEHYREREEQ